MPIKLAISGKIASGKSTLARKIADELIATTRDPVLVVSFAAQLRHIARLLFPNDMISSDSDSDSKKLNKQRRILQDLGAACKAIDPNVWINALDRQIAMLNGVHIIIDDLRFPDELEYCKRTGFTIVRLDIDKPLQEQRIRAAYDAENVDEQLARLENRSETALDEYAFEHRLNAGADVQNTIEKILKLV